MGGFQLILNDGTSNSLHGDDFVDHALNGTIDVPRISTEEILDRSKSDSIAKGIVVIQTAWFVLQCIHRAAARLTITELEITTLGHAITNFVICWCWWNKPKDVGLAIHIVGKSNVAMPPEKALRGRSSNHTAAVPRIVLGATKAQTFPGTDEGPARNCFPNVSDKETNLCPDDSLTLRATPSFEDPISSCGPIKEPSICQTVPTNGTEIDRPIPDTGVDGHRNTNDDANVKHDTEALKKLPSPPLTLRVRLGIPLENFTVQSTVPTRTVCVTILFIVASVFGAVHCAAWNARFPTSLEKIIWRFAAAFVTVTGGCLNIVINIRHVDVEERDIAFVRGSTAAAEFPLIVLYCGARLTLLVLALLALRALPYMTLLYHLRGHHLSLMSARTLVIVAVLHNVVNRFTRNNESLATCQSHLTGVNSPVGHSASMTVRYHRGYISPS